MRCFDYWSLTCWHISVQEAENLVGKWHCSLLRSHALRLFNKWFPHFCWKALCPLVDNLLLFSLCRLRIYHCVLNKVMKRNTWKGSYDSFIDRGYSLCRWNTCNHIIRQKLLCRLRMKYGRKLIWYWATIVRTCTSFTNQTPDKTQEIWRNQVWHSFSSLRSLL